MKGAIMLSGGGGTKLFAAIGVTYPAGSTLTCTNGTKTLTAKPKSEDNTEWVFAIPEEGTWTVTSTDKTDSTKTKSQSVSITEEGQLETVTLSYAYVLFDAANGGQIVPWKAGAKSEDATVTITDTLLSAKNGTSPSRANLITSDKIDITGYATLKFNITKRASNTKIGTCTSNQPFDKNGNNESAVHYITPVVGENSVPLTGDGSPATSGAYYIFLSAHTGGTITISADRVWLE